MPILHASVSTALTPEEVVRRLTDFGPARSEAFPGVGAGAVTVHARGETWAEVTEGNRVGWERERYSWDAARGTVSAVTLESNLWGPGSRWDYGAVASGTGSTVTVTAVRTGVGVKGALVAGLLSVIGTRMIRSGTAKALS